MNKILQEAVDTAVSVSQMTPGQIEIFRREALGHFKNNPEGQEYVKAVLETGEAIREKREATALCP